MKKAKKKTYILQQTTGIISKPLTNKVHKAFGSKNPTDFYLTKTVYLASSAQSKSFKHFDYYLTYNSLK
eukprot:snap_masked-scaffold_8-processed-gene-3.42-mRNA-1 protein AED:1.00 eAED:1.00 QI:0/-1/0/0/-1/1/1/0/68